MKRQFYMKVGQLHALTIRHFEELKKKKKIISSYILYEWEFQNEDFKINKNSTFGQLWKMAKYGDEMVLVILDKKPIYFLLRINSANKCRNSFNAINERRLSFCK